MFFLYRSFLNLQLKMTLDVLRYAFTLPVRPLWKSDSFLWISDKKQIHLLKISDKKQTQPYKNQTILVVSLLHLNYTGRGFFLAIFWCFKSSSWLVLNLNLLKEKSKVTYSLKVKTAQIHQELRVKMPFCQKVVILTKIRPKIRLFWKKSLISDHGLLKRTIVGALAIIF